MENFARQNADRYFFAASGGISTRNGHGSELCILVLAFLRIWIFMCDSLIDVERLMTRAGTDSSAQVVDDDVDEPRAERGFLVLFLLVLHGVLLNRCGGVDASG
jgi:hypothetical protein